MNPPQPQTEADGPGGPPRLLFVVNRSRWFLTHRLPIAERARDEGFEVHVAAPPSEFTDALVQRGFHWHPIRLRRGGRNPFAELRTLSDLIALYGRLRPAIVHHVTMKPVLYGTMAARITGVPAVVNAMTGLGHLFLSTAPIDRLLRRLVGFGFRIAVRHPNMRVLVQNPDDLDLLVTSGWLRRRETLLMASGVDTDVFHPRDRAPDNGVPTVLFPARMLRPKGLLEFIEAAKRLRGNGVRARFVLAGGPDPQNPLSVSEEEVRACAGDAEVEYVGDCLDMPELFRKADIVCLPSHREGMPKALLEASASGVAIVTTETAGCRHVVSHGVNGLLVPVGSVDQLVSALELMISDREARESMGRRGRERALNEFSSSHFAEHTLIVYRELLPQA